MQFATPLPTLLNAEAGTVKINGGKTYYARTSDRYVYLDQRPTRENKQCGCTSADNTPPLGEHHIAGKREAESDRRLSLATADKTGEMQAETAEFAPGAATRRTRRNIVYASPLISAHSPYYAKKRRHQSRTKPRP